MNKKVKIEASDEAWDSGQLGRDEKYVRVSKNIDESKIDDAAGLKLVSIRLQNSLIEDFKNLAKFNGIGYQPLMRQVLKAFAEDQKIRMTERPKQSRQRTSHQDKSADYPEHAERIAT